MDDHDRLTLHELPGRYGDLIDNLDWAGLSSIFTDDATFEANGRMLRSLKEIRAFMEREVKPPLTHLMTNVYVDETDAGVVLHSRLISMRSDGSVESGHYRDVVVKRDEGWRVTTRVFAFTPR